MGTTANLGIVYPDPSGAPSRQAWVEDPIKSVDAKVVAYLGKRVKGGASSGTIAIGQTFVDVTITFGTPFATTPSVTSTAVTSNGYRAVPWTRTANDTTIRIYRPDGSVTTVSATVPFTWTATDLGNS